MATSGRREKDQNMAAAMKRDGVERQSGRCPTCYGMVANGTFWPAKYDAHIVSCPGPTRKGSRGR